MQTKIGIQRGTYDYDEGGMVYRTLMVVDHTEEAALHIGRIGIRIAELAVLYKQYAEYKSGLEGSMVSPLREEQNAELKAVGDKPKFNHALAAVEGHRAAEKLHLPNLHAWNEKLGAVQRKFSPLIKAAQDECVLLCSAWFEERGLVAWEREHIQCYGYYHTSDDKPYFTWRTVEIPYAVDGEDTLAILGG